jgi:hypothetical protein
MICVSENKVETRKENKMRIFSFLTLLVILFCKQNAWSFSDDITHPELVRRAIPESTIEVYLKDILKIDQGLIKNIGGREIRRWIEYGSMQEDSPMCRASNHFHNPHLPWQDAGLSDTHWLATGWCFFSNYQHDARISALTWGR